MALAAAAVLSLSGFVEAGRSNVGGTMVFDGRRTMTLHAHLVGGAASGDVVIQELIKAHHVTVGGPLFVNAVLTMIRGGTCARRARGRAIRTHYSSEADVSFDMLHAATFAVDGFTADGRRAACADHRGPRDLRTNRRPAKHAGRARHLDGRIVSNSPDFSLRLAPAAGGRKTALHVRLFGEGNGDGYFRLRQGSCSVVGSGLELPFEVPGGGDGVPSFFDVTVPIPFATFRTRRWVAEDDMSFGGPSLCVTL